MAAFRRYPPTRDASLRVESAADRLLVDYARRHFPQDATVAVYHDRFGVVTLQLPQPTVFVGSFHSQLHALRMNAGNREVPTEQLLDGPRQTDHALVRIPKSLALFEFYLARIASVARPDTRVAAGFMTRHFSPRLLSVAGRYCGRVSQSRAKQKARLILMEDFFGGAVAQGPSISLNFNRSVYRQYPGVFSANGIDAATAFLLEHWPVLPVPSTILDVGCGNGIIGAELLKRYPGARLTAVDDFELAVASARLNLPAERASVLFDHRLESIPTGSQDLVAVNPPFHFGHENNIDVSLGLLKQSVRLLRPGGNTVVVSNRHLNYATHLKQWFAGVTTVAQDERFVVNRCKAPG